MSLASDLLHVASRVVWFQEPEMVLKNPDYFLWYVMQNGTDEDVKIAFDHFSKNDFRAALDTAPAGILDQRSWAYWNLMLNNNPDRPMPQRFPSKNP